MGNLVLLKDDVLNFSLLEAIAHRQPCLTAANNNYGIVGLHFIKILSEKSARIDRSILL
jgi:hypothetical protein